MARMPNRVPTGVSNLSYSVLSNVGLVDAGTEAICRSVYGASEYQRLVSEYERVDIVSQERLFEDYSKVWGDTVTKRIPSDPLSRFAFHLLEESMTGIRDLWVRDFSRVLAPSSVGGLVKSSSAGYYYSVLGRRPGPQ